MNDISKTDQKVIEFAKSWLRTPYRHQGYKKQIGCDCLGLIRGLWRELYGKEPERPKPYNKDWAEHAGGEPMLEAAEKYFGAQIDIADMHPGCLILFRWRIGSVIKHAGILTESHSFIHAYERVGVTSSPLVPSWRRRIAAVFEFPEITPEAGQ